MRKQYVQHGVVLINGGRSQIGIMQLKKNTRGPFLVRSETGQAGERDTSAPEGMKHQTEVAQSIRRISSPGHS